jgi:hypothetical protein|tara:strand:- start:708 stop:962 length:255 start_codon:yes stop_codon:yes gene_type:complete
VNLKLLFALIIIVEGEPEGKRTTYWRSLQDCRWYAQLLSQEDSYYQPVEKAYCEAAWVNPDEVEINSLKVRPKPVPEDNTNEIG